MSESFGRRSLFGRLAPGDAPEAPRAFSLDSFYEGRAASPEVVVFPAVQVAELDLASVERLLCDIAEGAELLAVSVKARPGAYAMEGAPSLDVARALLHGTEALGVQLRYRLGAEVWCDTLIRAGGGFRLTRVELPRATR